MRIAIVSDNQKFLDSLSCFKNEKIQCIGYLNAFVCVANNPSDIIIFDRISQCEFEDGYLPTKIHSFFNIAKYPLPRFIVVCEDQSVLSEPESFFCEAMSAMELSKICKNL